MATDVTITIAGGTKFYFPGAHVARRLDKQVHILPTPRESTGLDLLMSEDTFTLTGRWKDDQVAEFDGLSAFRRYANWMTYWKQTGGKGLFTWSSVDWAGTVTETYTVMIMTADFDKDPGAGKIIEYNIRFAVVKA